MGGIKVKKIISALVLICILMSQLGHTAFAALGKASEWAVPELTKAEAYGLIPDTIKSDMSKAITRKEFAEVCVRVYELTIGETAEAAPASTFTDTQDTNVLKAFKLGIVTGIGDGKFGPDTTTNREQIATMLIRLLNALTPGMHSFPQDPGYADGNQISAWAKDSVDRATQLKFITGWDSQFHAKGLCTREMAVIIAKRVYEFYNGEEALKEDSLRKTDILAIAEKYYQKTVAWVEEKSEFLRIINFTPDFCGSSVDAEKAKNLSIDTASLITFTNAKNMSTAFAAAVFTLDPDSAVTANNLAAAIASCNDRLLESGQATDEAYQDAVSVYLYALQQSKKEGKLTSDSLNILVSLGNLYLDTNQYKQAYAAFSEAYQFDKDCSGAKIGLMNYYLAKGDLKNALKYADGMHYPVMAQKVADLEKEKPDVLKEEPVDANASEEKMEEAMDRHTEIPVLTTFDFYQNIDPQAYADAKDFVDGIRGRMLYTAPDITIISQYSSLQNISQPMGQSALESFAVGIKELYERQAEANAEQNLDTLEGLGVDIDFGGVSIEDIIANPEAYENLEPDITGLEDLEENAMDMAQEILDAMNNLENNNYEGIENVDQVFSAFSKVLPENEIFAHNPFEYGNYLDFFVQRYNVSVLQRKMNVLPLYAMKVNNKVNEQIIAQAEALGMQISKLDEAQAEEEEKLAKQLEDSDLPELERARRFHAIHEKYRPQRNNYKSIAYNQLTTMAIEAYLKKIKPNAEKVYNDGMGHIMLISDEEVQKSLEDRLVQQVLNAVTGALNNVLVAHSIAKWEEPFECCDLPELEAAEAARLEAEEAAAREQALNDEEARKKFEACEIDENTELYKRYIKPYEVNINTIVFKGTISPYKSSWNVIIGSENLAEVVSAATGVKSNFGAGVNFGKMTNHFSNATTYNGGLTFQAKAGIGDVETKLTTNVGASLTKGPNGIFSPNDVDIYSDTSVSARAGLVSATSGIEVSAARGTRFHGKAVITGDKYLDKYKQDVMGHWPDIDLKIWEGQYKKE
jgi:hypothetical protein